jgi:hypothetical protein
MRSLLRASFVPIIAIFLALPAVAEERPQPDRKQDPATLTGKEQLGRKWMDEQRIDNCNVPPEKRGAKARPVACPHTPNG